MNRSLKWSMLMALALGSSHVLAMDLGQIRVKSALGQPLLAEIPLHAANPSELKNLTVQLASSEEFARAGISGGPTAIPLHFSVASNGREPVIRITSSVAVDDPYLDLLLEVNGSFGKSVREFTVLLDPPGSAPAEAAQARTARRSEPVTSRRSPTTPTAVPAAAGARHAPSASAGNGQYGPVQRGQTLSAIARNTAPAGVDVHQMLLALKQANPDAFYHDNINALKSGVVLRVPTATEAQAMEVAAAVAEVRRQNSDWRAGATGKPGVVADAGTRASASSSPSGKSAAPTDRLALVPAKEGGSSGTQGNTAGAKGDKSSAAVRQDLLRTQESLASLQQQTTDLKTRLKDLTDINGKNERLLSLKDNEIAQLQNELAAARKKAGMPAVPATPALTSGKPATSGSAAMNALAPARASTAAAAVASSVAKAASSGTVAASAPAVAGTAAIAGTSSITPAAVAVATAPPATRQLAKPVTRRAPSPVPAENPWYMQTWAWGAGAVVVVLLILASMLGRRRKPLVATGANTSLADRFGSESPAEGVAGDDVDQEELLDQLAEHPDDIGLHLELVTLYYSRRDVDHFEAAAEAMHAHITDPQQDEWQDVVHMGEDLAPGHPLFDHHHEVSPNEESEARRAFDIDDYAGHEEVPQAPPPMPAAPKQVSEYNFNFDLTSANLGSTAAEKSDDDHQDALPEHGETSAAKDDAAPSWQFEEPARDASPADHGLNEFSDDPVDTKLDLARAYLDMGDADGARAMLGEVIKEGSQMQQDVARRLLESMH